MRKHSIPHKCKVNMMTSTHHLEQGRRSKGQSREHGSTRCCHCLLHQTSEWLALFLATDRACPLPFPLHDTKPLKAKLHTTIFISNNEYALKGWYNCKSARMFSYHAISSPGRYFWDSNLEQKQLWQTLYLIITQIVVQINLLEHQSIRWWVQWGGRRTSPARV